MISITLICKNIVLDKLYISFIDFALEWINDIIMAMIYLGGIYMNRIKKFIAAAIVSSMAVSMTGCSKEGKALYGAMNKSQQIKSCETVTEMKFNVSAKGFTADEQKQADSVLPMLNNSSIKMNSKMIQNNAKTAAKVQSDMALNMGGMSMDMGVWVESDFSGSKPVIKEVVKMPAIATSAMGSEFAGKDYIVMDYSNMSDVPEMKDVDFTKIAAFSKDIQPKMAAFMTKYVDEFNPSVKVITDMGNKTVGTDTLHMYQLKLDDKGFKALLKYSSDNLLKNKDAAKFVKEYMTAVMSVMPMKDEEAKKAKVEMEQAFADFDKNLPQIQAEMNKTLDSLKDVKLIGDNGVVVNYGVNKDGYIVSEDGSIEFVLDMEKMNKLSKDIENQNKAKGNKAVSIDDKVNSANKANVQASKAVFTIKVDYSSKVAKIDSKDIQVTFPQTTKENSINYTDLLKAEASKNINK